MAVKRRVILYILPKEDAQSSTLINVNPFPVSASLPVWVTGNLANYPIKSSVFRGFGYIIQSGTCTTSERYPILPVKNLRGPFDQREPTNCALQVLYVKKTLKNKVEDIQRFLILLALQPCYLRFHWVSIRREMWRAHMGSSEK